MGEIFIILVLVLLVYIAYRKSRKIKICDPTTVYGEDNKGENSKKVRWVDVSNAKKNTLTELSPNQKYAIVQLVACVQGASSLSAFSDEANNISEQIFLSIGLSKQDVGRHLEKHMKSTMYGDPEQQFQNMLINLKSISDKDFLNGLYKKCMRIAEISKDMETIILTKMIFNKELGVY